MVIFGRWRKQITFNNKRGELIMVSIKKFVRKYSHIILILICIFSYQGACDPTATIQKFLDDAIAQLSIQSSEWQNIMNQLIGQLDTLDDALSQTIRGDVQNLVNRGVAAAGTQVLCILDIIGDRQKNALIRMKNNYLGTNDPVPELLPYICEVVPNYVDLGDLQLIDYYGYDLDMDCLKLTVLSGEVQRDVTEFVNQVTHYNINVFPSNLALTNEDTGLRLSCASGRGSEQLSTIGIQDEPPTEEDINPGTIAYRPPHTRGDREFDGNGPNIWCNTSITRITNLTQLRIRIYMVAEETKSDWTTATGEFYKTVYTAPSGKNIKQILTVPTSDSIFYTDNDLGDDTFPRGSTGLVNLYVFVGDTAGDDAGVDTQVTVVFNPVEFLIGPIGSMLGDFDDYQLVVLEPEEGGFTAHTHEVDEYEVIEMIGDYQAELGEREEEVLGDSDY
jgi:hypothetical protein